MPRVSDKHKQQMRERIGLAALRCFARKGFRATSMADIIAESGLSAGAIYGYFRSKDELARSAAQSVIGLRLHQLDDLARLDPPPPPGEAVVRILASLPDELQRGILVQLWGEAMTDAQMREVALSAFDQVRAGMSAYLQAWWRHRGATDDEAARRADEIMPAMVGLAQGYFVSSALFEEGMTQEAYLASLRVLLDGWAAGVSDPVVD